MPKQLEISAQYYNNRLAKHGWEKSVTEHANIQKIRFDRACAIMELPVASDISILDIGCGTGDFLAYLLSRGFNGSYTGYDPWEEAINQTAIRFPKARWVFQPKSIQQIAEKWGEDNRDFVVLFSVFSHRADTLSKTEALFMDAVDVAYRLCNVACALTAKSPYKTEARVDEAILDPMWMWQIGRRLSERVLIDHSYFPYESMLVLFKQKSEFRKLWGMKGGWDE